MLQKDLQGDEQKDLYAERFAGDGIAERFCWGMALRNVFQKDCMAEHCRKICRGMTLQKDLQGDDIAERFAGGWHAERF